MGHFVLRPTCSLEQVTHILRAKRREGQTPPPFSNSQAEEAKNPMFLQK